MCNVTQVSIPPEWLFSSLVVIMPTQKYTPTGTWS